MQSEFEKKSTSLDLVTRLAHDLCSPIAVMEMSLQMIEQRILKNEYIILRMSIQRMRDIANNLLDQHRQEQVLQPILIHSLLEQVIMLKRYEWLGKNCELTLSFNSVTDTVRINGISSEIKRMLSNLLNNAIEACEQDAQIQVCVDRIGEFVELTISDNGVGIPPQKVENYLNGESSKHSGTGLGLSGAKQYMESVSGKFLLTSQPGIGTTITLNFLADSC